MDSATVPDVRRRTSAHGLGAERRPGLRTGLPKLQLQLEGPAPGRDLGESRAAAPATPPRLAVPGDLRELSVPQMGLKKIDEQRGKSACLQSASHKIVAGTQPSAPAAVRKEHDSGRLRGKSQDALQCECPFVDRNTRFDGRPNRMHHTIVGREGRFHRPSVRTSTVFCLNSDRASTLYTTRSKNNASAISCLSATSNQAATPPASNPPARLRLYAISS